MSLANTPTSLLFSNWQRLAITRVSLVPKVRFQQGSKLRLADRRQAAAAALQGREQCARVETQKDRLGNFALNKSNQVVESVRGRACCQSSLVVGAQLGSRCSPGLLAPVSRLKRKADML